LDAEAGGNAIVDVCRPRGEDPEVTVELRLVAIGSDRDESWHSEHRFVRFEGATSDREMPGPRRVYDNPKGLRLEQATERVVTAGAVVRTEELGDRRITPDDRGETLDSCHQGDVVLSRHARNGVVGFDLDHGKSPRDAPNGERNPKKLAAREFDVALGAEVRITSRMESLAPEIFQLEVPHNFKRPAEHLPHVTLRGPDRIRHKRRVHPMRRQIRKACRQPGVRVTSASSLPSRSGTPSARPLAR